MSLEVTWHSLVVHCIISRVSWGSDHVSHEYLYPQLELTIFVVVNLLEKRSRRSLCRYSLPCCRRSSGTQIVIVHYLICPLHIVHFYLLPLGTLRSLYPKIAKKRNSQKHLHTVCESWDKYTSLSITISWIYFFIIPLNVSHVSRRVLTMLVCSYF